MKKPRKITAAMLRRAKACREQLAIFEREWPDGAEVTEENALQAMEIGLDTGWLEWLMPRASRLKFQRAFEGAHLTFCDAVNAATRSGAPRRAHTWAARKQRETIAAALVAALNSKGRR
jgi:hypothetical protein